MAEDKTVKRYQDCNLFIKIWRRRWYFAIPYWACRIYFFKDENIDMEWDCCWSVSKGLAQSKMNWFYTTEEVFASLQDKLDTMLPSEPEEE